MTKLCVITAILLAAATGPVRADDKPNTDLQNGTGEDRPWAKGVSQAEQDAALALFSEGNSQLNNGLFQGAADKYKEALKHWDHPAIHYNLALALFKMDKTIEVAANLEKAIAYGPAPLDPDKFEHATELLAAVNKDIAFVEVSCNKTDAEILVDNGPVENGYKSKVKAGKHTFVCRKPGSISHVTTPKILGGETFRVELKLHTPDELTRYKRRWNATWMPYAVLGGGAAVAAISGLVELSAKSSYKDFDAAVAQCNMNNAGCPTSNGSVSDLRKSGDTKQSIAYVGYAIGGAAIVTGAVMIYLNREVGYHINAEQLDDDNDRKVSVAPVVTPTMAGAVVQGHF